MASFRDLLRLANAGWSLVLGILSLIEVMMTDFIESRGTESQNEVSNGGYHSNPRWFGGGVVCVGVSGALLSGLSFREHLRSKSQAGYASFCDLGGSFNCREVIASEYATILGMPTALFGVAFYLSLFFLGVIALRRTTRGLQAEALILSSVAAIVSIALASISFFILKAICILCLGIYTVNAIFFFLSLVATVKSNNTSVSALLNAAKSIALFPYNVIFPGAEKDKFSINLALLGVMVNFSLFMWLSLAWMRAQVVGWDPIKGGANGAQRVLDGAGLDAWQRGLPLIISETKGEDLAWGPEDAKVTVVEFTDFECPACRAVFPQLEEAISEFKSDIRVVFKQYPLSSRCNPNLRHDGHQHACFAAKAALCINRLRGGAVAPGIDSEKIANGLFTLSSLDKDSSSEESVQADILELGRSLGVQEGDLLKCIGSDEVSAIIERNIREGDQLKIQGTPSIFIAGKEVAVRRTGQLKAVLRKAIETAKARS